MVLIASLVACVLGVESCERNFARSHVSHTVRPGWLGGFAPDGCGTIVIATTTMTAMMAMKTAIPTRNSLFKFHCWRPAVDLAIPSQRIRNGTKSAPSVMTKLDHQLKPMSLARKTATGTYITKKSGMVGMVGPSI